TISRRKLPQVCVHATVNTPTAVLRAHVDALDPPEVAVSPVAPLLSHHQSADHFAAELGDAIEARIRPAKQVAHAGTYDMGPEALALRLERHGAIERDEVRSVAPRRAADFDGCPHSRILGHSMPAPLIALRPMTAA